MCTVPSTVWTIHRGAARKVGEAGLWDKDEELLLDVVWERFDKRFSN